jgi:hypothetical protein
VIRLKTLSLAVIVAAVALVPLFGDPRVTPVTHPLWARLLLRALDMEDTVRVSPHASDVFAALSWRDSLTFAADRFLRADGVVVEDVGGVRRVTAAGGAGQVVYPLGVARPGDYRLRLRAGGGPDHPAVAEVVPVGRDAAPKTFTFVPAATVDWVGGQPAHLDPGAYTATVLLPPGSTLEQVEVAPPCLNPIEPAGGWRSDGITTAEDLAVTVVKVMDREDELPPADLPLERSGADFAPDTPSPGDATAGPHAPLRAGRDGLHAVLTVDLPAAGLYTLSAYVVPGEGQRWLADGCRKAVLCRSATAQWRAIMSQPFAAGRHSFSVLLADGGTVERVRLERKKASARDYVAALRRLGFDPGPDGPVRRDTAAGAARFLQERQRSSREAACGDVVLPPPAAPAVVVAEAAAAPGAAAPSGAEPAVPPLESVLLPTQPIVSPVEPLLVRAGAGS